MKAKRCRTCDDPRPQDAGDYWMVYRCPECDAVIEVAEQTVMGWPLSFRSRDAGEVVATAA
ncbi:MAG: hypothetical protein J2P17_28470 [Mycobacterium sp.]|nr:hypothetical protein [Mycobacterium sp.]